MGELWILLKESGFFGKFIAKLLETPHTNETKKKPKAPHIFISCGCYYSKKGVVSYQICHDPGPIRKVCLCWACTLDTITNFDAFLANYKTTTRVYTYLLGNLYTNNYKQAIVSYVHVHVHVLYIYFAISLCIVHTYYL